MRCCTSSASSSERFISCTNESTSDRSTQSSARPASIKAATRSSTPGSSSTAVGFISSAMVALHTGSQTGPVGAETTGRSRYPPLVRFRGNTGRREARSTVHGGPLRKFASIVAGRRSKWVVLVVWLIAIFAVFPLGSKLSDQTTDSTESFLPASAESTEVVRKLEHDFPQGQTDTGIVVYKNSGGLTAANKQKIAADAQ